MCRTIPVLSPERARFFFKHACHVTGNDAKVVNRQSGKLFDGILGLVGASDRMDFTAKFDDGHTERISHGILFVETYDKSIKVTYCLVRTSYKDFLTCGWMGDEKRLAVKTILTKPYNSAPKKWWQFWK